MKLVYYDDQSNPATIPGLYTKLLDVDKVDLVVSGYATNMIAPAMPVIMQHDRTFLSLLGLAANTEFHYPKYFSFTPTGGPHPKQSFAAGFFAIAMAQIPSRRRWPSSVPTPSFRTTRWTGRVNLPSRTG